MSVVGVVSKMWRPLICGSAAVIFGLGPAFSQSISLAERIKLCSACHGEDGNSRIEKIPSLAGQPDFFVLNQLSGSKLSQPDSAKPDASSAATIKIRRARMA